MRAWIAWVPVVLLACKHDPAKQRHTEHAPVDPAFDLGIVVPASFAKLRFGMLQLERTSGYADANAWATDMRALHPDVVVGDATDHGDLWELGVTSRQIEDRGLRLFHHVLGGDLGVNCAAEDATAAQTDLVRRACLGLQRVDGGIFVATQFAPIDDHFPVDLTIEGEPEDWRWWVNLRVVENPKEQFDPKYYGDRVIERGGTSREPWFILGQTVRARRRIGALDLACMGFPDPSPDHEHARRTLALCLDLEQP